MLMILLYKNMNLLFVTKILNWLQIPQILVANDKFTFFVTTRVFSRRNRVCWNVMPCLSAKACKLLGTLAQTERHFPELLNLSNTAINLLKFQIYNPCYEESSTFALGLWHCGLEGVKGTAQSDTLAFN